MYKLMTTEGLLVLEKHHYLKDELQHIRATGSADVMWIEQNNARYVSEFIKVDGKFIEVFVFQPEAEHTKQYQTEHKLFSDSESLSQGM